MKKQKIKKTYGITTSYKTKIIDSELDIRMCDSILGRGWDERERFEEITLGNTDRWHGESTPISIDRMIKHLQKLKSKGCNYVEIFLHTDHIGYELYGMDIHRSTDKEIDDEYKRISKEISAETKERIIKLKKELEILESNSE